MDISNERLEDMIQGLVDELQEILYETRPCSHWTKFQSGTKKEKLDLSYNVPMGYFSDKQHELILRELSNDAQQGQRVNRDRVKGAVSRDVDPALQKDDKQNVQGS